MGHSDTQVIFTCFDSNASHFTTSASCWTETQFNQMLFTEIYNGEFHFSPNMQSRRAHFCFLRLQVCKSLQFVRLMWSRFALGDSTGNITEPIRQPVKAVRTGSDRSDTVLQGVHVQMEQNRSADAKLTRLISVVFFKRVTLALLLTFNLQRRFSCTSSSQISITSNDSDPLMSTEPIRIIFSGVIAVCKQL